jgi:DNA-directed RNA polymerase beta' subunit
LGIEAARQSIFIELSEAMDHAGVYINYHHVSLLCDRMAATLKMVSIFRHGINNDDIGPIAKASFEETPEMFLRAARHGELDAMTGISANIMCGQEGYFGTGSFQVILDFNKMTHLQEEIGAESNKILETDIDISAIMGTEGEDNGCSKQNIQINNTSEYIEGKDTGVVDDEYDPGF